MFTGFICCPLKLHGGRPQISAKDKERQIAWRTCRKRKCRQNPFEPDNKWAVILIYSALSSRSFLGDCQRSPEIARESIPRRSGASGIHFVSEPTLSGLKNIVEVPAHFFSLGEIVMLLAVGLVCLGLALNAYFYCIPTSLLSPPHGSGLGIWPLPQLFA